jgi:hypothetical protein
MKSFVSPSFFRLFDLLMSATNPSLKHARWSIDGVACEHERHSFTGRAHSFAVETFTLTRQGRYGWSLLVVKEYWWTERAADAARITRWARPTGGGNRRDILAWLQAQETPCWRAASRPTLHSWAKLPPSPLQPTEALPRSAKA